MVTTRAQPGTRRARTLTLVLVSAWLLGACRADPQVNVLCNPSGCHPIDAGVKGAAANGGNAAGGGSGAINAGGVAVALDCGTKTSCNEHWSCTAWQTAQTAASIATTLPSGDNAGTRTCSDLCMCGTTTNKPTESVTLRALDFDFYQCEIEPIFDGSCAQLGCHGSETGHSLRIYARSKLRISGETWTFSGCGASNAKIASDSCIGDNECACWQLPHSNREWQRNYDAARGFALDDMGKSFNKIESSPLLLNGLARKDGGTQHAGAYFYGAADPVYAKLRDWLSGAATGCVTPGQRSN